ncbi:SOS response-associated peptidase [Burkholderia gladioli]|uniref:SOS response-associated peptidase n=1 Tax=Burkholderia gladioli TaxID=28095 RepID=UPI001C23C7C3|nr:SOS response-associated peptidase family protein [Burkholderia gladioli]MBU9173963.1 SOS response-associated peptidase [Burkholderia gladioli]
MCTHYRTPNELEELNQLRLPLLGPLYEREPWKQEIYPDYLAPIVRAAGDGADAVLANFGMIPKAHQPPGKRYMTVNARSETVGEKPAFRAAWRAGQRCLIPAAWIYEPNWETGKHVKYRIGLAGWRPFCIAGVWRTWKEPDDTESIAMAMLTVNADEHDVMKHMHRPDDEKRSVVILRPEDHEEWLHAKNPDSARGMLQPWPGSDMVTAGLDGRL